MPGETFTSNGSVVNVTELEEQTEEPQSDRHKDKGVLCFLDVCWSVPVSKRFCAYSALGCHFVYVCTLKY